MPHIQQLSSHVADLIAAGEVVERPASVVKELVENAIDAGASAIVVEIQRGGMGLIRVTDNGCGIAPDELPTAFLRHATSKLRTEEDLGKIGTLGFRGEALAAISAVSRVDVLTRQSEDAIGAAIHGEGGAMGPVREEGAPAVERYQEFLSSGGKEYPLETLKKAGVDLTRPDAVLSALDVFESALGQLAALVEEEG